MRQFHLARVLPMALLTTLCYSQDKLDPWPKADLLEPAALALELQSAKPPVVLGVAFSVLYRSKHILHAIDAGPGSKPEGIELLKKAVAGLRKDADLVNMQTDWYSKEYPSEAGRAAPAAQK